jgi:hypothetical protein
MPKRNVSETGFCLRLQVKPTQLGPIDRASPYWVGFTWRRRQNPVSETLVWNISRTAFYIKTVWWIMFRNIGPGKRIRYSDWLRDGQLRGRSSSPGREKNFLFSMLSRPVLGPTQLPIQWEPGGAVPPGVKQPEREADHSPLTSAEVKKTWIYTSSPPYAFRA